MLAASKFYLIFLLMNDRIARIKEMLTTQPNDAFLRHAMALEFIKMGNQNEARKTFEALLCEQPDYVGSYYHLAKLHESAGATETAVHWYQQGMEVAQRLGDRHAYNELRSAWEELTF